MRLHMNPVKGLDRCRSTMGMCPYGGATVHTTVTRFYGTPEEKKAKRDEFYSNNSAKDIATMSIRSTGSGKHIRGESKNSYLTVIQSAMELVGSSSMSKVYVTDTKNTALQEQLKNLKNGDESLSVRNSRVIHDVFRANSEGSIEDNLMALKSHPQGRRYIGAFDAFELRGNTAGNKTFDKAEVYPDMKLKNDFNTRIFKDGRISVGVNQKDGTVTYVPLGKIQTHELPSGQFLRTIDRAITAVGKRKLKMTGDDLKKTLRGAFSEEKREEKRKARGKSRGRTVRQSL